MYVKHTDTIKRYRKQIPYTDTINRYPTQIPYKYAICHSMFGLVGVTKSIDYQQDSVPHILL